MSRRCIGCRGRWLRKVCPACFTAAYLTLFGHAA